MFKTDAANNVGNQYSPGTPGVTPATTISAEHLNAIQNEPSNLVESSGQTLSKLDSEQVVKALAVYASKGDFYKEAAGSAADVYVLEKSDTQKEIFQLKDGMRIRFKVVNTNTGASTVDINSLGAKSIVFRGSALIGGEIALNEVVEIVYSESADNFEIKKAVPESTSEAGITASVTQTQGQQPLLNVINEISVVANTNDVVTLPPAVAGRKCLIINTGANLLQIFPASGDDLGNGVDTSGYLGNGGSIEFNAYDSTNFRPCKRESFIGNYIYVAGGAGHGSVNTYIRRIETLISSSGTSISLTQSSSDGTLFTINESGVYHMSYCDRQVGGSAIIGISLNSSQLSTDIGSINTSDRISSASTVSDSHSSLSASFYLSEGDLIRPHTNNLVNTSSQLESYFIITKIS